MKLAILIQHHPSRPALLERTLQSIDGPAIVVPDPDPDSPVRSAWRTYRACLEALLEEDCDAGVILQDDTIACRRFHKAAVAALEARPGRLITFFSRVTPSGITIRQRVALAACDPFLEFPRGFWVPTVALAWPRELAAEFLDWPAVKTRTKRTDDPIVGEWATATERGALASVPSLVEHPDDEPSYIKSNNGTGKGLRTAACWIADTPVEHWIALL